MHELTICGQPYSFNFGLGFVKEIDKTATMENNGYKRNIGLQTRLAELLDGDIVALADVLLLGNKGQSPRLTYAVLEKHIDDPETDIDALFDEVLDFLRKTNASGRELRKLEAMMAQNAGK